jgi:hypothetical protein
MAPGLLTTETEELHTACEEILATTDAGVQGLSHWYAGAPSIECCDDGMLAVWPGGVGVQLTSPSVAGADRKKSRWGSMLLARWTIVTTRCVPLDDQGMPDFSNGAEEAFTSIHDDVWALWNGLMRRVERELLFAKCHDFVRESAIPLPLQGGCGGWTISVSAWLPGFSPEPEGT